MKKIWYVIITLNLLLGDFTSGQTSTPNSNFVIPNGVVGAMVTDTNGNVVSSSHTIIGGHFSMVGRNTGSAGRLSTFNAEQEPNFPSINGFVTTIVPDGSGGCYVGGSFTRVGTKMRNNIARINSDGSVNEDFNPNITGFPYGYVLDIETIGNNVVVGGDFDYVGGQANSNLVLIDTSGRVVRPLPRPNLSVNSLAIKNDKIYIVGEFTFVGGQSRERFAAIDTNGNIQNTAISFDKPVKSISPTKNGGWIFSGDFTTVNDQQRSFFAAVDSNGNVIGANLPNLNAPANALETDGEYTYVGLQVPPPPTGTNIKQKSDSLMSVFRIDSTFKVDTTWKPWLDGSVNSIALGEGIVFIGGSFTSINGVNVPFLAKLTKGGDLDTTWLANPNNNVNSIALSNNTVFVGGGFSSLGSSFRRNLARINNLDGSLDQSWKPDPDNTVLCMVKDGNFTYVGGKFTSIDGFKINHIARLESGTGKVDTLWNPDVSGEVNSISVSDNHVYIGGNFGMVGDSRINYLARVSKNTGMVDTSWNPGMISSVKTVVVDGAHVYIGGTFITVGDQFRRYVARLNTTDGRADSLWDPNANDYVKSIVVSGEDIYIGGDFTSIGGQRRKYIAKLNSTTGTPDSLWNPSANDYVNTLLKVGDYMYVGGSFTFIGGNPRNHVAKIDLITGATEAWNPNASSDVNAILAFENDILIGGSFSTIGGYTQPYLALFTERNLGIGSKDELKEEINPNNISLSQNYPNPFNPTTSITFTLPVSGNTKLTVYSILGEKVTELLNENLTKGIHSVQWNATEANHSSGVYFYELSLSGDNGKEYREIKKMMLLK